MQSVMLSVIVPAYNVEKYIIECIDSIVSEIPHPNEIIIVNDGSTDNTLLLLEQHYLDSSQIRIISISNGGTGVARDIGIALARGRYLFFCDPDDIIMPGLFKEFSNTIINYPAIDMFCFNSLMFTDGHSDRVQTKVRHSKFGLHPAREVLLSLLENGNYTAAVWNYIVSRAVVVKHNLQFYDRVHEDHCFTVGVYLHSGQAWVSRDSYYRQRIRKGSLTNSDKTDAFFEARYNAFIRSNDLVINLTDTSWISGRIRRFYLLQSFRLMIYLSIYNKSDVPGYVRNGLQDLCCSIRPENLKGWLLINHTSLFIALQKLRTEKIEKILAD